MTNEILLWRPALEQRYNSLKEKLCSDSWLNLAPVMVKSCAILHRNQWRLSRCSFVQHIFSTLPVQILPPPSFWETVLGQLIVVAQSCWVNKLEFWSTLYSDYLNHNIVYRSGWKCTFWNLNQCKIAVVSFLVGGVNW